MSFCPKCGNNLVDNVTFCPKCGNKVVSNTTSSNDVNITADVLTVQNIFVNTFKSPFKEVKNTDLKLSFVSSFIIVLILSILTGLALVWPAKILLSLFDSSPYSSVPNNVFGVSGFKFFIIGFFNCIFNITIVSGIVSLFFKCINKTKVNFFEIIKIAVEPYIIYLFFLLLADVFLYIHPVLSVFVLIFGSLLWILCLYTGMCKFLPTSKNTSIYITILTILIISLATNIMLSNVISFFLSSIIQKFMGI